MRGMKPTIGIYGYTSSNSSGNGGHNKPALTNPDTRCELFDFPEPNLYRVFERAPSGIGLAGLDVPENEDLPPL